MTEPTPAVVRQRVAEGRVGVLATVTADGRPHVVPCCYVLAGSPGRDTLYSAVDAKPKTTTALRRLENLATRPWASLLVDRYAEDWATLWWIRLDGSTRVLHDGDEFTDALVALRAKYAQYGAVALPGPVIALDVATWRWWP